MKPLPSTVLAFACLLAAACAVWAPIFLGHAIAREGAPGTKHGDLRVDPQPKLSSGVPLVTLPWGAGLAQVGLSSPPAGLVQGPEAFAVAGDGRLAILDSVNRRVLLLGSSGQVVGSIPLDLTAPRFLAVTPATISVLDADSDHRLVVWDWAGNQKLCQAVPETEDPVTALIAHGDSLFLETAHRDVVEISLQGSPAEVQGWKGSVSEDQATADKAVTGRMTPVAGRPIDKAGKKYARARFARGQHPTLILPAQENSEGTVPAYVDLLTNQPIEHLVALDGDGKGGVILGARILRQKGSSRTSNSSLLLMRVVSDLVQPGDNASTAPTGSGAEVQALRLSDSGFAYVGQPYVVGSDGRVYQPIATEHGYSILVHTFPDGGEE